MGKGNGEKKNAEGHMLSYLGGDTECPLQVCLLSRSSVSTFFAVVVDKQLYYCHG